jgi:hypothetical protein
MGCPALGIWVCFLKQPALPGKAPQKKFFKKNSKKYKSLIKITNESKVVQKYIIFIFWGRSARQCIRLFQKSDPNPQSWTSHLHRNICYVVKKIILPSKFNVKLQKKNWKAQNFRGGGPRFRSGGGGDFFSGGGGVPTPYQHPVAMYACNRLKR